jgi:hypothetical protein
MKSKQRHEGYLLIDHRFSPGVPESEALRTGFDPKLLGEGKILESATITCAHCLGVVVKNPMRIRERGYCPKCDKYLCDHCEAKRHAPGYQHASGEAISDAILESAVKGTLGSPLDLLNQPKIFVP